MRSQLSYDDRNPFMNNNLYNLGGFVDITAFKVFGLHPAKHSCLERILVGQACKRFFEKVRWLIIYEMTNNHKYWSIFWQLPNSKDEHN